MWLYTTIGFFSIVQKPGALNLTVRARVRADLERLRNQYLPDLSEIEATPSADYAYRATVPHATFAHALSLIAKDIAYPNFKATVEKSQGTSRAQVYSEIWADSCRLQSLDLEDHVSAGDRETLGWNHGRCVTPELMMRALYHIHENEPLRTWRCMPFFAAAEKLKCFSSNRPSDQTSEDYAMETARGGLSEGWIKEAPSSDEWRSLFSSFIYGFLYDDSTFKNGDPWLNSSQNHP